MGTDSSTPDTGETKASMSRSFLWDAAAGWGLRLDCRRHGGVVGQAGNERRIVDRRPGCGAGARRHVADDALFAHPLSAAGDPGFMLTKISGLLPRCYCNATSSWRTKFHSYPRVLKLLEGRELSVFELNSDVTDRVVW